MPSGDNHTPPPSRGAGAFASAIGNLTPAQIVTLSGLFGDKLKAMPPSEIDALVRLASEIRELSPAQIAMMSNRVSGRSEDGVLPRLPKQTTSAAPVTSPADLGALVRAARKAAGLDQQALADLAGVGRRFVSELENGKATLEFGKVLTVAAALGIDLLARKR